MANISNASTAPVNAANKKSATKKEERAQKPPSSARVVLMTLLLVFFLLAACTALIYFNVFDARQIAVNLLLEGKSPYTPQIEAIEELTSKIAADNMLLEQSRADIEARETQLQKREADVAAREAALAAKTAEADARAEELETAAVDMTQLAAMYEKMDAASAARIFEEVYDNDDIARLLTGMKQANASAILAALTPERAARITELMLDFE